MTRRSDTAPPAPAPAPGVVPDAPPHPASDPAKAHLPFQFRVAPGSTVVFDPRIDVNGERVILPGDRPTTTGPTITAAPGAFQGNVRRRGGGYAPNKAALNTAAGVEPTPLEKLRRAVRKLPPVTLAGPTGSLNVTGFVIGCDPALRGDRTGIVLSYTDGQTLLPVSVEAVKLNGHDIRRRLRALAEQADRQLPEGVVILIVIDASGIGDDLTATLQRELNADEKAGRYTRRVHLLGVALTAGNYQEMRRVVDPNLSYDRRTASRYAVTSALIGDTRSDSETVPPRVVLSELPEADANILRPEMAGWEYSAEGRADHRRLGNDDTVFALALGNLGRTEVNSMRASGSWEQPSLDDIRIPRDPGIVAAAKLRRRRPAPGRTKLTPAQAFERTGLAHWTDADGNPAGPMFDGPSPYAREAAPTSLAAALEAHEDRAATRNPSAPRRSCEGC